MAKKKRIKYDNKILLIVALIFLSGKGEVSHADINGIQEVGKASISLTRGGENPTEPLEESKDNELTGSVNSLRIDSLTPILFGNNKIEGATTWYRSKNDNPSIQVSDHRGSGSGWALQVKSSAFIDKLNGNELKGTQIILPQGKLVTTSDNISMEPKVVGAEITQDFQTIMSAKYLTGLGTWVNKLDPNEIKLKVSAGNLLGNYEATIVWLLIDSPKN